MVIVPPIASTGPRPAPPTPAATGAAAAAGILLVEDHELVRLGFRALVHSQVGAQSQLQLYEAATLAEALAFCGRPGAAVAVVVLDLALPDADGVNGLVAFRQRFAELPVVVLSGTGDRHTVRRALALGAVAFFPKSGDLGELVRFVHGCVLHGPQQALAQLRQAAPGWGDWSRTESAESLIAQQAFSTRQLQVLQWVLEGRSNRDISELACLSEGTVKNYVSMLLLSFAVRSRAELISKLRP